MATTNYDPEGIAIAPDRTLWLASEGNASDSRPNLVRVQAIDDLITSGEKSVYNMLPNLKATNGWITDKPEGVAITSSGRTFVVTDRHNGVSNVTDSLCRLGKFGVNLTCPSHRDLFLCSNDQRRNIFDLSIV